MYYGWLKLMSPCNGILGIFAILGLLINLFYINLTNVFKYFPQGGVNEYVKEINEQS
jgi:hypothetical protein